MAASDTKIPCSTETRRKLRHLKASADVHTYDAAISLALDAYEQNDSSSRRES